jgi:hypothetical protein
MNYKFINKSLASDGSLWITGIATTNRVDRENESLTITPRAFIKANEEFMKKGAPVWVEHGATEKYGEQSVGRVVSMDYFPKRKIDLDSPTPPRMKIKAVCKITDKDAVQDILKGELEGFSISLRANSNYVSPDGTYYILTDIEFNELTICKRAMNPDSDRFEVVEELPAESVNVFNQPAMVKSMVKKDGQKLISVRFPDLNLDAFVKAEDIQKTYTTKLNSRAIDRAIRIALLKKIRDEGYSIPASEVAEFSYSIPRFTLSFGKKKRHTTEVTLGSNDKISFHTKITNAEKKKSLTEKQQEKLDETFKKYNDTVNMSASELEAWSETEASKQASLSRAPINRNLRLLRKKKEDWTMRDVKDANRTISFVSRMRGVEQGEINEETGYSDRDVSLKNWAFDPRK